MTPRTQRADLLLVERGLAQSRPRAQALIGAGQVYSGDRRVEKAGEKLSLDAPLAVRGGDIPYVSRGGLKLEAALDRFGVSPAGRVCADLGASTGGFTDCLLQRGAARVHAIDVGYGQLAWKLRQDPRVVVHERTNARTIEDLGERVSLVVGDLSFISLRLVLPAIARISLPGADCVLLVKPQFEVGREGVSRGGLVRDEALRQSAVAEVHDAAIAAGFAALGQMESPIVGAKAGNVEHLIHLTAPDRAILPTVQERLT